MFREKPVGKWIGPNIFSDIEGKLLTLDTGERTIMASIDKVKLYSERERPRMPSLPAHHSCSPDDSDVFFRERQELDKLLIRKDQEQTAERDNPSEV